MGSPAASPPDSPRKANQPEAGPSWPRQIGAIEKFSSQTRIYITSGGTPPGKARSNFAEAFSRGHKITFASQGLYCPRNTSTHKLRSLNRAQYFSFVGNRQQISSLARGRAGVDFPSCMRHNPCQLKIHFNNPSQTNS
jgi:hypothetical protein